MSVQLTAALRDRLRDGTLGPGDRLPASRPLASALSVSRTVVNAAYQQLYAEGWLEGRHGSGTYVALYEDPLPSGPLLPAPNPQPARAGIHARTAVKLSRSQARDRGMIDLRPGAAWAQGIDTAVWRRALRRAAGASPDDEPDPCGLPHLRELVAEHVRRVRAVPVGPQNVLITRGTGNGLDLVAAITRADARSAARLAAGSATATPFRAGVEDPGYRVARNAFAARGAEVVPCPVDWDGIRVGALPDDLSLLYTTPVHQWPLGGRLPIPRRERLLAWARRTGALVVEDDYDAEFRYDVAPLPALYGLDPGRVVLLGTLSKTLAAEVGIGWVIARPALVDRIAELRRDLADRTPGPSQHVVAHLLASGDLDRHLRRMRLEYARRRAAVVDLLGPYVRGDTAGLHVMLPLSEDETGRVVAAASEHGILLEDTTRHSHATPPVHGVILGYGSASLTDLRQACRVLVRLLPQRAE